MQKLLILAYFIVGSVKDFMKSSHKTSLVSVVEKDKYFCTDFISPVVVIEIYGLKGAIEAAIGGVL